MTNQNNPNDKNQTATQQDQPKQGGTQDQQQKQGGQQANPQGGQGDKSGTSADSKPAQDTKSSS